MEEYQKLDIEIKKLKRKLRILNFLDFLDHFFTRVMVYQKKYSLSKRLRDYLMRVDVFLLKFMIFTTIDIEAKFFNDVFSKLDKIREKESYW